MNADRGGAASGTETGVRGAAVIERECLFRGSAGGQRQRRMKLKDDADSGYPRPSAFIWVHLRSINPLSSRRDACRGAWTSRRTLFARNAGANGLAEPAAPQRLLKNRIDSPGQYCAKRPACFSASSVALVSSSVLKYLPKNQPRQTIRQSTDAPKGNAHANL
nr:hypothetical protein [uncultured Rhodopila sp.]